MIWKPLDKAGKAFLAASFFSLSSMLKRADSGLNPIGKPHLLLNRAWIPSNTKIYHLIYYLFYVDRFIQAGSMLFESMIKRDHAKYP